MSSKKTKKALAPKRRFPEFRGDGHWKIKKLTDICVKITQGGTPSTSNSKYWNGSINWITPAEMGKTDCPFISKSVRQITEAGLNACSSELLPANSIIISTRAPIGLLAINTVETAINQGCKGLIPNAECYYKALYYLLLQNDKRLNDHGAGNTFKELSSTALKKFLVPIPSPAEQRKIAECLTSLDEVIAGQGQKVEALKAHKKGLMQQLFPREGETTPRLRFPEFHNAGEWEEQKLDDLIHFQDGFAFKSTDFVKAQGDATQIIRITDINNKNTNEDKVYIPTDFLQRNKLGRYQVENGDLLLSLTGAAGFNFFFWNGEAAVINQRTAKVTSKRKSGNGLLQLLEPLIHEKINVRGEGQNNNLSKEFLSTIVIRIPEPDEQRRIADCLTSLDELITAHTEKHEALKTFKKGLMQQLFPAPEEDDA